MKKILVMLIALSMLTALSGCGAKGFDPADLSLSEYDQAEVNTDVQLYIKQKTVTAETEELALSLINLTDTEYSFDAVSRLEVLLDGNWYLIPDMQEGVIMSIYHLPAQGTEESMFYFAEHYDELPRGSYRIVKLLVSDAGETAIAAAQFDI